jgi:NAD(P)-dependent dehydrogenase (short-subunit alcohol dehydrogenase family)
MGFEMAKWTVAEIPSQSGRVAVVTGANSGIGWHTALELARAGAEVVMAARTEAKGQDAVARIREQLPQAKVRFERLDLASLRSVREFAARVSSGGKLNLLVNNAGVMRLPVRQLTEDGFETQMGTNFLGPFALTVLLMPALLRSEAPRVTTVSSGAANMGLKRIRFEDIQWEKGYKPWAAYCQSKLADLMLTTELARRSVEAGGVVLSTAAHPGWARTNLQTSGVGRELNAVENFVQNRFSQDSAHGALPTLRAATAKDLAQGSYFGPSGAFELTGDPVTIPLPKPARDGEAARRLWNIAEELTEARWNI